jgi:twitching motility protein PilT
MLLDDSLFRHWKNQVVSKEDVLSKSHSPDELAARIAAAERGVFDDDEDVEQAARNGK